MNDFKKYLEPAKKLTIEDRLYLTQRKVDSQSHIEVNQEEFRKAMQQPGGSRLIKVCPAKVYNLDEATGNCLVAYENCVECGTCQVACRREAKWDNPNPGFGIVWRFG